MIDSELRYARDDLLQLDVISHACYIISYFKPSPSPCYCICCAHPVSVRFKKLNKDR